MPIPAGVIGDPQSAAPVAFIHMPTKLGGPAGLDGAHGPAVASGHSTAMDISIGLPEFAEDLSHFRSSSHETVTRYSRLSREAAIMSRGLAIRSKSFRER